MAIPKKFYQMPVASPDSGDAISADAWIGSLGSEYGWQQLPVTFLYGQAETYRQADVVPTRAPIVQHTPASRVDVPTMPDGVSAAGTSVGVVRNDASDGTTSDAPGPPPQAVGAADLAVAGQLARDQYTVDGTDVSGAGVKIGIISDSFINVGGTPDVTVLPGGAGVGTNEGDAMADVAYATAPGAEYYFDSVGTITTTGTVSTLSADLATYANAVSALQAAGCDIIVDDISLSTEPFFGQSNALNTAIASFISAGGNYFAAAGNDGPNYYQGTFSPVSVTIGSLGPVIAMDFGGGNPYESLTIAPGTNVALDLQWDQPFGTGDQYSLAVYLFDSSGDIVSSGTIDEVGSSPVQVLNYPTLPGPIGSSSYSLAVVVNGGSLVGSQPFRFQFVNDGANVTINDPNAGQGSGELFGHVLVPGVNVVGAANVADTPSQGVSPPIVEASSEYGPTMGGAGTISFVGPDGSGTSLGALGFNPFNGTSAAAPVAAAVAALILQENPELTNTEITRYLAESAISMGNGQQVGAGLIQADTALGLAQDDFLIKTEQEFDEAIQASNLDSGIQNQSYTITIKNPLTFTGTLSLVIPSVSLQNSSDLDIVGGNYTDDFDNMNVTITAGTVSFDDATIFDAGSLTNQGTIELSASLLSVSSLAGTGTVEIGSGGAALSVAGSTAAGATIEFNGTANLLKLYDPDQAAATISGFLPGDTIDLAGIGTADGASLDGNNVLTVSAGTGTSVTLNLDPTQNFNGDRFLLASDDSGGTLITVESDTETLGFTGTNEDLLIVNPVNQTGTITDLTVGDTIDLADAGIATDATLGAGNVLTVQGLTAGPLTLSLDPTQDYSSDTFFVEGDGAGGTNIVPYAYRDIVVPGVANLYATVFTGVNDAGQVVGFYGTLNESTETGVTNGFIDNAGTFTELDVTGVANVSATTPSGINAAGQIVGSYQTLDPTTFATATHGFLDTDGTFTSFDVPDVANSSDTRATGINGTDEIVGHYETTDPVTFDITTHGFIDNAGAFTSFDMPGIANLDATVPTGVNDAGEIVGDYSTYDPDTGVETLDGFTDISGSFTTFDVPGVTDLTGTTPTGINDAGQIVGYYSTYDPSTEISETHGFLDTADAFTSFDVPGATFPDEYATLPSSINDAGQIAGYYEDYATYNPDVGNTTGIGGFYAGDGFLLNDQSVPCFCRGTRILTDRGEAPVESLSVGDRVNTMSGAARPIVWIGAGSATIVRGRRGAATPILVRKGALADNVPHSDLRITKGHSLHLDGVLVPAEYLVNHRTILWDDHAQTVEFFHIELATHEVLFAEGAAAETYRDDGNRWMFGNANSGFGMSPKHPCAPVLTGGPVVDALWRRLLDRAGPRPGVQTTDDPDLHLLVDGRRVDAAPCAGAWYRFRLATTPSSVRVVSRAAVPQELGLVRDPRPLGVAVQRIVVTQGVRVRTIEADDLTLAEGFHAFEPDNAIRWTNGDAALPVGLFTGFTGSLEIALRLGGRTTYLDEGTPLSARRVA
jgi:hypothetical protein